MISLESYIGTPTLELIIADCKSRKTFAKASERNEEWIGLFFGLHGGSYAYSRGVLRRVSRDLPPGNFLDLGSGAGTIVIEMASESWNSYGIDFCHNCYELGNENIKLVEKEKYIKKKSAKIAHGNFFPKEFVLSRTDKKEDSFREDIETHLHTCQNKNPYQKLHLKIKEIDLFYHYQVERKDNILRLFAQQAKPEARLFFVKSFDDAYTLPPNIEKESELDSTFFLYRKRE